MNTSVNNPLRAEVTHFMYVISLQNRIEVANSAKDFSEYLKKQPDPSIDQLTLFVEGIVAYFENNYQLANFNFKQILESTIPDTAIEGIGYLGLGLTNRSLGNLDEAVTYFFSTIDRIDKESPFKDFLVYSYHQLGEIHTTINEYSIAIEYFTKAFESAAAERQFVYTFRNNSGLGDCYRRIKDYEKSKYHLMLALKSTNLTSVNRSRGEYDLGKLYLELKEFDEAERLLVSSLEIREKNGLEDAASTSMISLAEVYIEQNKIIKAIDLLNRCLLIVERYNTKWKKVNTLYLLGKAHCLNGDFKLSISFYEQYIALNNETKSDQERKILKIKNKQIEKQKQTISQKHSQLVETFEEIKRLKVNRKAVLFSWITIIVLVMISELFLDPFIENYAYNSLISLFVKILIALLFKPLDGLYEKILWDRTLKKVD